MRLQRPRSGDSDGEGGNAKKARVVWSVEMHQQFVNAVNTLGVDSAPPPVHRATACERWLAGQKSLLGLHQRGLSIPPQ